jgi:hypothetical protein
MGTIVDRHQVINVDLGIALGGAQTDVAEQFLDGAKISAFAEEVGGEAVAQSVGRHPANVVEELALIQLAACLAIAQPPASP